MSFVNSGGCDNFRKSEWAKYKTAHDLGVAVAKARFKELDNPNNFGGEFAVGIRWGDAHIKTIYLNWQQCVADVDIGVKEYEIMHHGGYRNLPSPDSFVEFVHYWTDTPPGGDSLKDW